MIQVGDITTFVQLVKKDPKYQRLINIYNTRKLFQLDPEEMSNELELIHASRLVRNLSNNPGEEMAKSIIDANMQDQSYRSRVVEIKLKAYRSEVMLARMLASLNMHLITSYSMELNRVAKTQAERKMVMDSIVFGMLQYISKMSQVQTIANMVVDDIDKAAWSLKLTKETLEINTRREFAV